MNRCVEVRTHSRLHFGLTSLGHEPSRPQFGGVGVMVADPGIVLRLKSEVPFAVTGPLQGRVERFAQTIAQQWQLPSLPEVHIEVVTAPREHVGLGVGTQLALAVAAGLGQALGFAWRDPLRLAQLTGRGRRSAVGTHGFLQGGLIVDGGHRGGDPLGELVHRCDFPAEWRFVMFVPTTQSGRAGPMEERAFAELPPVPVEITEKLETIANTEFVPAIAHCDFSKFGDALYRYGSLAGQCFSAVQGGTFCSPVTATLIDWLRAIGVAGVGQSSWGPTVFALMPNQSSAEELVREFASYQTNSKCESMIVPPANQGATVSVREN